MDGGWIKLYRKFQDWEWYTDSQAVHLFLHLLLSANNKDKKWRGKMICRGELITSVKNLSEATEIPVISVRRKLKILQGSGVILVKTTNRFSDITIYKYDDYQTNEQTSEQTNEQTNEQQLKNIRSKEVKNKSLNRGFRAKSAVEKPKENKPKKAAQKESTLTTKARELFELYFKGKTGEEYYWKAVDATQMKRLLNQLRFSRKNRGLTVENADLLNALQVFLNKITDNWILGNLSVSNISSKYNELVAQAKAGKTNMSVGVKINTSEMNYDKSTDWG